METPNAFHLQLYMGEWYDLLHYPSPFQSNDTYNTKATYTLNEDGTVAVVNSTMSNGMRVNAHGVATSLGENRLRVEFERGSMEQFGFVKAFAKPQDRAMPNYVINRLWLGKRGSYQFAVVSNPENTSLWVLSRKQHPSRSQYERVLAYVLRYFDKDKMVATPHYDTRMGEISKGS
jgi:apolipoprotein D and lipocalin family protein